MNKRTANDPYCKHKTWHIETNSKGRRFKECNRCGAFLGWVK